MVSPGVKSQTAIIQDKDGWTNLRKAPHGKAEIIGRIPDNVAFGYDVDDYKAGETWISVSVNERMLGDTAAGEASIHRSRVLDLQDAVPYTGTSFHFRYVLTEFNPTGRVLTYHHDSILVAIDQQRPWGTDGNLPKVAVREVEVRINEMEIPIPSMWYEDLFECSNAFEVVKVGSTYFVHQWNSDGAGGYQVVWVIDETGVRQRLVTGI